MLSGEKTFSPLPNTFSKDGGWTADQTGLPGARQIDVRAKQVAADLGTTNNATWHRTYVNARVSTAHMRNPNMEIPGWMWEQVHDSAAALAAGRTLANIPLPESRGPLTPVPAPPSDYINQSKNHALVVQHLTTTKAVLQHLPIDDHNTLYGRELNEAHDKLGNSAHHAVAEHLNHAASALATNPNAKTPDTQAMAHMVEAWRLFQLLDAFDEIASKEENKEFKIGDEDEPIETNWQEVIDNLTAWEHNDLTSCTEWGDLTIRTADLDQRIAKISGRTRKKRLTDAGAAITRPDRIMTDGMCFSQRGNKRDFIGAVLIDNSGSMSFSVDQVDELIEAAPGVIIAHYSGGGGEGELTIVAQGGKRTSSLYELDATYGGNNVDGPALDWLGQQTGPRVWISDGYVTNKHDEINRALVGISIQKCINYDITRVRTLDQLVTWANAVSARRS